MKLTLTVLLVLVIFSTAVALKCNGRGGEIETCKSDHDQCGTVSSLVILNMEITNNETRRFCIPSAVCDFLNGQTLSLTLSLEYVATSVQCCSTDGCNSGRLDSPDRKPNGLQCKTCADVSGMVCNMTAQCVGAQDRCFENKLGKDQLRAGCVTSNMCSLSPQQYEDLSSALMWDSGLFTCSKASPTIRLGLFPLLLGLVVLSVN